MLTLDSLLMFVVASFIAIVVVLILVQYCAAIRGAKAFERRAELLVGRNLCPYCASPFGANNSPCCSHCKNYIKRYREAYGAK